MRELVSVAAQFSATLPRADPMPRSCRRSHAIVRKGVGSTANTLQQIVRTLPTFAPDQIIANNSMPWSPNSTSPQPLHYLMGDRHVGLPLVLKSIFDSEERANLKARQP